jgi:hypothetical protein
VSLVRSELERVIVAVVVAMCVFFANINLIRLSAS